MEEAKGVLRTQAGSGRQPIGNWPQPDVSIDLFSIVFVQIALFCRFRRRFGRLALSAAKPNIPAIDFRQMN